MEILTADRQFPSVEEQMELYRRGAVSIIPEEELEEKIKDSIKTNTPLKVKLGLDPSRPDIHLGHTVVLRKLRQFQDCGHQVILVVGDFTATIGDPSGRNKTRPPMTLEETRVNGRTYFEQASRIIDPDKTRIVYNSEWLEEMSFRDVIELASNYTVARMLERDDFEKRYKAGEPISVHEFLYPLAQAMDSVELDADIELGGTDQTFNLLVGRTIQIAYGQEAQAILTTPLLEGTDGVEKMSKSLDNYIALEDPPEEIFGKTMSIPDNLIYKYFELLTDIPGDELESIKEQLDTGSVNPMNLKRRLGRELVALYYDREKGVEAEKQFDLVHKKKEVPDDIPEFTPETDEDGKAWIVHLITGADLADSNSQARRLIKQGGVRIDGEQVEDFGLNIEITDEFVLQVGKRRFVKIVPPEE
ncbi:MAG: tyrosine--tRNA ligase [Candidatus Marinimicrobia bacterium]|nr:tyrosine--tRNA ligase [Candidatus Neomarinimicrobiota bacterium]MCF7829666.1 tyrosine--tRNA ligase [Candidatus Neomarinimicrobiota bacterium]MCF7879826.1 tyrosine--tRNA ligase [Candidatus Neomarinimicrobiota bacterium]